MPKLYHDGHTYESYCDMIDVTSNNRPDTNWKETDAAGHVHQWYTDGKPAVGYRPGLRYDTPTVEFVKDGVGYFEDGEPYDIGHYECVQCRALVRHPPGCPDTHTQLIPGIRYYRIDNQPVSKDEFQRRVKEATDRA